MSADRRGSSSTGGWRGQRLGAVGARACWARTQYKQPGHGAPCTPAALPPSQLHLALGKNLVWLLPLFRSLLRLRFERTAQVSPTYLPVQAHRVPRLPLWPGRRLPHARVRQRAAAPRRRRGQRHGAPAARLPRAAAEHRDHPGRLRELMLIGRLTLGGRWECDGAGPPRAGTVLRGWLGRAPCQDTPQGQLWVWIRPICGLPM
jgi:hypothetical protein